MGAAGGKGGAKALWKRRPGDQGPTSVTDDEIEWMLSKRSIHYPATRADQLRERLDRDYGAAEARLMLGEFEERDLQHLAGILAYPGVGTRWREFLGWYGTAGRRGAGLDTGDGPDDVTSVFRSFANHLGRVTSYRALALEDGAYSSIMKADEICPSGQLRTSADVLAQILEEHGVKKVVVARLYIAHLRDLIGHDPSVSLHDDWQTTTCIASGYAGPGKRVHLFEVSVPVIESVGWRLYDVAVRGASVLSGRGGFRENEREPPERWFLFPAPGAPRGVWFDSCLQTTERYGLWGIPFLGQRLLGVWRFGSIEDIRAALEPFVEAQEQRRAANAELTADDRRVFERWRELNCTAAPAA